MEEVAAADDRRVTGLVLNDQVVAALQSVLPAVAEHTVAAVTVEVPTYADAFSGRMGQRIEGAVQMALGAFVQLAARSQGSDAGTSLSPALEGAYELGRGEARSGRSVDALLSAYRVGARVAWRELSETAVDRGLPPLMIARFAELVFAYIDELSAASVSGHADELASSDRERRRHLDRLGQDLLTGAPTETLLASAERAEWRPPDTLTAVLLPSAQTRGVVSRFGQSTLQLSGDLPDIESSESVVVLLIADMHGSNRSRLLRELQDRRAVVGPSRPWTQAHSSYHRVLQARELHLAGDVTGTIDTETHLVALVLGADREAADDLRHQVLAPLDQLRPNTAERLAETLRSWLLHQGQRDAVAADLFVHAQTVRYRMTQIRELYGERLNDPQTVLEVIVALSIPTTAGTSGQH
ncbi:PucR family transcriptional regulator [Mycolicibacterium moriokaense]|uniref:PucR-like helix-turn-helix protein n=1 Tax=Mycolicibacterium moriokaense TaxID=39691 RepID=A0A318HQ76_9MYCO|nr:PucR family transcriptional regulator [Mycolicibacterium moriokaense]PXX06548.1 PucR-like helix-turn-helix protein [Mycolicibacterium moriokaense]